MQTPVTKIREYLTILKLGKILDVLDGELTLAMKEGTTPTELLERLLSIQAQSSRDGRIERRIRESKLPERKLLADFDFKFQPRLDKGLIMELATLEFVRKKQGLILAGCPGTGKSHIAKSLLFLGCGAELRCRYTTGADMLNDLSASLADNSLPQAMKKYISPDMLLIDEVGFDKLERQNTRSASLFFKIIEGRYCKASTLLTCNVKFDELADYLGDPTITSCLVDRLVHHSVIIHIDGPSYRAHSSGLLNQEFSREIAQRKELKRKKAE